MISECTDDKQHALLQLIQQCNSIKISSKCKVTESGCESTLALSLPFKAESQQSPDSCGLI